MKPTILYHASTNKNIILFEPRAKSTRDPAEGPVVFATPSLAYASCFLVKTDGTWVYIGSWNDGPWVCVISDEDLFKARDIGGAIYSLPSNSFYTDPKKGARSAEYVSKVSVAPVSKVEYESGLEAMLDCGVQVFFVKESVFSEITNSNDQGLAVIMRLEKENKSLNQQLKRNVIKILNIAEE